MGSSSARLVLVSLACATVIAAGGCGFPSYGGFADPAADDAGGESGDAAGGSPGLDGAPDADGASQADSDAATTSDAGPDAEAGAGCTSDPDCSSSPEGPLCEAATGRCGACRPTDDQCPVGEYCAASTLACVVGCRTDADCTGGTGLTCDAALHQCVGCKADADCPAGSLCASGACAPGCNAAHACQAGTDCCSGSCFDLSSDPKSCGACGHACPTPPHGFAGCSGGACGVGACEKGRADCDHQAQNGCEVDVTSSVPNCGACGSACAPAHAVGACNGGACSIATCNAGFGNCDALEANGCEADLGADLQHCGTCEIACSTIAKAVPACLGGACAIGSCLPGFADCDGKIGNGCETDIASSAQSCGACGVACSLPHANASCSGGHCEVVSCNAPWFDCDGIAANGCEVDSSSDPAHCGSCTKVCAFTNGQALCTSSSCALGACASGYANCDLTPGNGCETNLVTDPVACGACGTACVLAHATAGCAAGGCSIVACAGTFKDCNAFAGDGCEANVAVDVANCGSCGTACSLPHATAACSAGLCAILACATGFADCDGNAQNGCEVDTTTSATHCGGCNTVCSSTNGAPSCASSACSIACSAGFGDCDGTVANGCERPITNDAANCGACNAACSVANGTPTCSGTTCAVKSCAAGFGDCDGQYADGCETQLNQPSSCGACGVLCNPPNATGSCSTGTCKVVTCNAGFGDCDGSPANGCEVVLGTDVSHCGSCTNVCPSGGGTPTCSNGICSVTSCPAGLGNCDGNASTGTSGCERPIHDDVSNCGGCGVTCSAPNSTPSCTGTTCGVAACLAGFGDCDANASNGCEASLTTLASCGACGTACSRANGSASCATGACVLTACNAGFGNCDGNATNGCEATVTTDVANCGACGNACSSANGTPSCTLGACGIACTGTFKNCDGSLANGCETDTATSTASCGACGYACSSANGTPSCAAGACAIACSAGFADCDANVANGCETATSSNLSNCGVCGHVCSGANGTASCTAGTCAISCNAGFGDCDGNAANGCETALTNNAAACGACGAACAAPHATPSCTGTTCGIGACDPGWGNCDGNAANGCETKLDGVANCGACGVACTIANGTGTCASGTCAVGACGSGWADCNTSAADGCEQNLAGDPAHCGACTTVCGAANGTPYCSAGTCGFNCNAGFGNCDGVASNGCEASFASAATCGNCTTACGADQQCASAKCLACGVSHLLISEVRSRGYYGGGDEFIELYNPTPSPIVLDATWTIEARSTSSTSYTGRFTGAGQTVAPYGHFLIGGFGYSGPTRDAALSSGITDASSVRLLQSGTPVDAICYYFNATTLAAYDSTFTCQGTPVNNAPHNDLSAGNVDQSLARKTSGSQAECVSTGDNAADFVATTPSTPENSASAPTP